MHRVKHAVHSLGFFVAGIVARWWEQFNWISWPDKLMMLVSLVCNGEEYRSCRGTIARWSNLQVVAGNETHGKLLK